MSNVTHGDIHVECQGTETSGRDFSMRRVKRLVADELILSFVPDAQQRLWRTVTRRKYQLTRNRCRVVKLQSCKTDWSAC